MYREKMKCLCELAPRFTIRKMLSSVQPFRSKGFHHLRRTALRNLRKAGVPESVAMKISGHKTREVFERYDIKDRRDVIQALDQLAQFQLAEDQKLEVRAARPN